MTSKMFAPPLPACIATLILALTATCATAAGPPTDIAARIRAGGRVVDGPAMSALYTPLQNGQPSAGLRVERDRSYGPSPQNLADVFMPQVRGKTPLPVLIFVHGGGFTGGERRVSPTSPFYDNVGSWAARHGFIGVDITYRRAPQGAWPAGAEDVGRAVNWVRATIARDGGDADRVYVMGHSAGATHVASYVADKRFWGAESLPIRGAIIVSGSFVAPAADAPEEDQALLQRARAYFGDNPSLSAEQASLPGLVRSPVPLLIVNAEYDPPYFRREAARLAEALKVAGRPARVIVLPGHNHMSQIYAVNTADRSLTEEIERFVAADARRRPHADR